MEARKGLGNEGLELLAGQRRSAENVHLPEEADVGDAVRAGAERAGAGVDERIRQNQREASGAAPVVHDAGDDDRLGEHIGANAGNEVGAVLGRERGRVAGVIVEKPAVDRRIEIVARRAGVGGRAGPQRRRDARAREHPQSLRRKCASRAQSSLPQARAPSRQARAGRVTLTPTSRRRCHRRSPCPARPEPVADSADGDCGR